MNRTMKMIGIGTAVIGFAGVVAHLTAKTAAEKVCELADAAADNIGDMLGVHTGMLAQHIELSDKYETLNKRYKSMCEDYDMLLAEYEELLDEVEAREKADKDGSADEDSQSV